MNPTDELAKVPQFTKIRAVVCAMICNVMIGAYYFFSNINLYVASYLRSHEPSITAKDTLLIMPIYIVCQSAGTIISISLCQKYGYVKVSNLSYIGFALVNLIMVWVTNYWLFVFLYGVAAGLLIGFGYMPSLFIAWSYYPDKKSIVTGVSLFTAGISASILSPLSTAIVNPPDKKNYEDDETVYGRVPFLFFCLFLYYGSLSLIGSIMQPQEFVSQSLKELQELKALDDANKAELGKDEQEMEVINPNSGDLNQDKKINEVGPATGQFSDKELEYAVNKELRNDLNGFIAPQEAAMMNGMPAEKLMGLVINRKSIQVLINDRKESLRQSIRASMRRQSVRQSVAKLHHVQNTLQNKQKIDTLE